MELHELEHKTVTDLREMAATYDDVIDTLAMKKEQLIDLLCEKLGIDRTVHVPTGIGRRKLKARIQELKTKRVEVLAAHDSAALATVRHEIKSSKRKLRRIISRATHREGAKAKVKAAG